MSTSPDLGIPFIATQQASPEITHNEALLLLQALLIGVVTQQNAPPGSPTEGDGYLVGAAPTGAWTGKANKIAIAAPGGGWRFVPGVNSAGSDIPMGPRHTGLRVYRRDLFMEVVWIDSAWVEHVTTVGSI